MKKMTDFDIIKMTETTLRNHIIPIEKPDIIPMYGSTCQLNFGKYEAKYVKP